MISPSLIRLRALCLTFLGLVFLFTAGTSSAKTYLTITSQPSGAKVEIDGSFAGTTPFRMEIPGGYLHGTVSVFGQLLRHPMHVRLTLDGYLPAEADLTKGPQRWVALNGTDHGDYWLLKSDSFNFNLEKAATRFTGNVQVGLSTLSSQAGNPSLSVEQIVLSANSAVLQVTSSEGAGSGFLVTETGIGVTNAHVVRGQRELVATTGNGQSFQAAVVFVDEKLDIALLKLEGSGFPQLQLANTNSIQPGSTVIAMGTPSKGFQNSATRGIVGGVGPMPGEPGTWVQTDASINPGNSGGPLLNDSGRVIGITTMRPFLSSDGRPLQGINFALSSDDLLAVLRRFYPNVSMGSNLQPNDVGTGKVSITANRETADIYVDGKFVGSTPAILNLPSGKHNIEVRAQNGKSWMRDLEVLKDSEVKLSAVLQDN